jgi:hypothetical protein
MIHAPEHVRVIRDRVASGLRAVVTLEAQVPDLRFRERLQLIRYMLEEIESFFLASLSKESRTPEGEAYWLHQAEMSLEVFIAPQLMVVQDVFAKYGPSVTMVG